MTLTAGIFMLVRQESYRISGRVTVGYCPMMGDIWAPVVGSRNGSGSRNVFVCVAFSQKSALCTCAGMPANLPPSTGHGQPLAPIMVDQPINVKWISIHRSMWMSDWCPFHVDLRVFAIWVYTSHCLWKFLLWMIVLSIKTTTWLIFILGCFNEQSGTQGVP